MFPAAILFGLAELLIPEMARCNAAGSQVRIKYLTEKSILIALIYGCFCGGILFLGAESLCMRFYKTGEAGIYLRWFAILAPMLYCDAIVDAITKGLGQQKKCVRNNIITSAMDVILLFILLPRYGMKGYFLSFLVTHMVNFALSFKLLLGAVGKLLPIFCAIHCLLSAILSVRIAMRVPDYCQEILFTVCFIAFLILFGCIQVNDFIWIQRLLHKEEKRTAQKAG
jgi:stage V sporulation protein B